MISVILHSILAFLATVGAMAVYILWRRDQFRNKLISGFFWFFVFFIGYHLSLILPFLFRGEDLTLMAWGYNFAIVFRQAIKKRSFCIRICFDTTRRNEFFVVSDK